MLKTILDTGPIVAFFDEGDKHSVAVRNYLKTFQAKLFTTLASPQQLGHVLELAVDDQFTQVVAPDAHPGFVEDGDRRSDLDVDRRPRHRLAPAAPSGERLQLVEGEQGGASVGCSAAADSAPADVGVQGGLGHPEDAGGLAGLDQRAHPPSLTGSVDRVNVDRIDVDYWSGPGDTRRHDRATDRCSPRPSRCGGGRHRHRRCAWR